MANPVYINYTTTGAKTFVSLNCFQTPFNASVGVYVGTTGTFAVQYTLDDPDSANARWFDDANIPTGTTTSKTSNYAFPVRAVRMNIAAVSGTIEFKVLQGL